MITIEEAKNLKPGDKIWYCRVDISKSGKLYRNTEPSEVTVTSVSEFNPITGIMVTFDSVRSLELFYNGWSRVSDSESYDLLGEDNVKFYNQLIDRYSSELEDRLSKFISILQSKKLNYDNIKRGGKP